MSRDWQIYNAPMVQVKGGAHLSGVMSTATDLGLAVGPIEVHFNPYFQDVLTDSFGRRAPAEILTMAAVANVSMTLVHYDRVILDLCIGEGMGGVNPNTLNVGTLNAAGTPLGNQKPIFASGNHFISLNLVPEANNPFTLGYRFRAAYLQAEPLIIPLGTEKSMVQLTWRAIPYPVTQDGYNLSNPGGGGVNPYLCSGTVLWDRLVDR